MGNNKQPDKTAAEQAKQEKANRLSKALRDNLHRRKAQARARKSPLIDTARTGTAVDIEIDNSPKGDG